MTSDEGVMIPRTRPFLTSWQALFPGTVMPKDVSQIPEHVLLAIKDRHPAFHAAITQQMTVEEELALLNDDAALTPPDPQQQAEERRQAQIAELTADGNPWGEPGHYAEGGAFIPPRKPNLTRQTLLADLDPVLAAELQQQAADAMPKPDPQQLAAAAAADAAARRQSLIVAGAVRP